MSRCPWDPNPFPGATRSSLITRNTRNPIWVGSWKSPNENVCRLSSQPIWVWPRRDGGSR